MGFLKKIKAKFEDFLQLEEEWKACILKLFVKQSLEKQLKAKLYDNWIIYELLKENWLNIWPKNQGE